MSIIGFIYLIVITLVMAWVFSYALRIRGPWGSFWTFFLVIFLAVWALYVWIGPTGPGWGGVYWLPPLAAALLVALILAAATPSTSKATSEIAGGKVENDTEEKAAASAVGVFFWITILLLALIAVIGLFQPGNREIIVP
jgi:hypothetical protein